MVERWVKNNFNIDICFGKTIDITLIVSFMPLNLIFHTEYNIKKSKGNLTIISMENSNFIRVEIY